MSRRVLGKPVLGEEEEVHRMVGLRLWCISDSSGEMFFFFAIYVLDGPHGWL